MRTDYREFAAGASLDQFVECFWTHEARSESRLVLPDGCVDLVFSRTTGLQLAGTMTRPLSVAAGGEVCCGVRFRPGLARAFLGKNIVEFTDKVLPLEDVWGKRARILQTRMEDASTADEMIPTLRLALAPRTAASAVQRAIQSLAVSAGAITLSEIGRQAGLSERQLRRRCLEETGITPKRLARISRFRRTCSAIHSQSHPDWASLASECGYYDQAHFIHDFGEFSGSTPGDYLRQRTV